MRQWSLCQIGQSQYLLYVQKGNSTSYGAWINLDLVRNRMVSNINDVSTQTVFTYATEEPQLDKTRVGASVTELGITLTISQTGLDANESAIYQISNNNGFTMLVELQGGNSVILEQIPAGSYTVTELTDWTWKNGGTANSQNVTVTENGNNQVTFTYTEPSPDWLGGEDSQNNKFSGQDNT